MATKRIVVFDGDSHVVEPPELWTKYIDPEFRTLGKFALWREEGKTGSYLKVNGKVFRDTMNSNIPRHAIWKPGMTWDKVGELDPDTHHPATECASSAAARLRDTDAMGIKGALFRKSKSPGRPIVRSGQGRGVVPRRAADQTLRSVLPRRRHSDIRSRRSLRRGSTIICSSRRR